MKRLYTFISKSKDNYIKKKNMYGLIIIYFVVCNSFCNIFLFVFIDLDVPTKPLLHKVFIFLCCTAKLPSFLLVGMG